MSKRPVIAVDGPAGSGKTTLAEALAKRLGLVYYDTGALYRAVTLAALQSKAEPGDERAVAALARTLRIELQPPEIADGRPYTVLLDGRDVTWDIRHPDVDAHVSTVAARPAVRRALLAAQRAAAARGGVVMVGRDVGTVIAPRATVKIYLCASIQVRAERRWRQLRAHGEDVEFGEVIGELLRRDAMDSGRATAPLRAAEGAVVIDTDNLTVDETVDRVAALLGKATGDGAPRVRHAVAPDEAATHTVQLASGTLQLSTDEYRLFAGLVRSQGLVQPYDELAAHLWGPGAGMPRQAVQRVAAGLRRKLLRLGAGAPRLETVAGRGYRLLLHPGSVRE